MSEELGICDLETGLYHERLFSCENWRPIKELGICDYDVEPSRLHEKTSVCVNWRKPDAEPAAKPEKPRHAVGVSVLLIENGNILLGRRGPDTGAAQGLLSTPGGRLEIEESIIDAAGREFFEETGATIAIAPLKIIGFKKHFRFGEHYIMFYVLATEHKGEIGNPEGVGKCDGWLWYSAPLAIMLKDVTEPKDILLDAFAEAERRK